MYRNLVLTKKLFCLVFYFGHLLKLPSGAPMGMERSYSIIYLYTPFLRPIRDGNFDNPPLPNSRKGPLQELTHNESQQSLCHGVVSVHLSIR